METRSVMQVRVDPSTLAILEGIHELTELIDQQGTVIGYFEPAGARMDALYREAALQFDPEEIRRSKESEGPWHTTAEVLNRLRSEGSA